MEQEIKQIIEKTKPAVQAHGGDIEFVDFDEKKKVVRVRLKGACAHCPMSEMTLKEGVLKAIQEKYPDIEKIEDIK